MPRKNPGPPCHVCGKPSKAKNLCGTHHMRWLRHGHLEQTRPATWGKIEKHPLYHSWGWTKKGIGHEEAWSDFWKFVDDVGERPHGHLLRRLDSKKKFGPNNFYWKPQCSTTISDDKRAGRAAYSREWRKKNPLLSKQHYLRKQFGLEIAEYDAMLAAQNGLCAICGTQDATFRLAVDHCHATGTIRGLLCNKCNQGLGCFKDSPVALMAAINYLAAPPAQIANAA